MAPIRERLDQLGVNVPLIGDFHFNGHKLLREYPGCATALAKYRINPGNVGRGSKRDPQFAEMIEMACRHEKPVRIGVNWGSLDQDLLTKMMDENSARPEPLDARDVMRQAVVASALSSAERAIEVGLPKDRIILSAKVSGVQDLIAIYTDLAARCEFPAAPGAYRGGHGIQGHRGLHGRHLGAAAAGHRRHHPGVPDAGAERRSLPGSDRRAGDPADQWACAPSRPW